LVVDVVLAMFRLVVTVVLEVVVLEVQDQQVLEQPTRVMTEG
jgi:hypothetical protein